MKKIIQVQEVEGEGLTKLLGQKVTLFCARYIYSGVLEGVNESCVLLKDAEIVYETGALNTAKWEVAEKLPGEWYVNLTSIESYGVLK